MKKHTTLVFTLLLLILSNNYTKSADISIPEHSRIFTEVVSPENKSACRINDFPPMLSQDLSNPGTTASSSILRGDPDGDSLVLFAGNDTSICLTNLMFEVSGSAENFYYTSWATTGDGFFLDLTNLSTNYVPGPDEVANGLANLYLIGICVEPFYYREVDSVNITLIPAPSCFAGLDASICNRDSFQADAQASYYSELQWSGSGDGFFNQTNVLNPTYHPGTADSAMGVVYLTLTAFENSPCVFPEVNTMSLTIIKSPQVNAGNDAVICHGTVFQIEASASDYEEILWTTSGDGYYSNPGMINPEYYPGNQDIQSGGVILYLAALPVLPCVLVETESLELTIEKNPSVDVGSDQTICEDQTVQCSATAENYASLLWYALGGDGYFSDPAILNPVYYPGEYEKTTGIVVMLLLAAPVSPCSINGNASFRLNLINNPVVSAGTDQTLCMGDSAEINATIQNCEELIWESSGDGFFTDSTNLSTRYFPGPADIENGLVSLFPVAIPVSPCETIAKDTIMLFIEAPALVDAGPDTTVCAEATITASVVNSTSYLWITEGDGSFSNPENLSTVYYAGQQDLEDQEVLLTLLALSDEPCEQVVEDDKLLVFDQPFIVESEIQDQEILSGETILLYFEGSSMQEVTHQWYHNSQPVDNANTPGFIIENSTPLHAGNYHCVCFNNCFELISDTVLITIYDPSVQIIQIEEGWNAVSSFVQPENTNIQEILDPIIGDIIIVFNEDGVFWPGEDFQTFYNWDPNSGYIIKSTCSSSFEIQGFVKHPAEVIIITPGWSILHVNACCQANISDMFASHPEISMIKEIGGCRLYWPEKGINTLESLKPGKAYEIFNAAGTETSIVFPGCFE